MGEDCNHYHLYYRLYCRSQCINLPISTAKKLHLRACQGHSKPKSLGFLVFLLNSKHLGDMRYCLRCRNLFLFHHLACFPCFLFLTLPLDRTPWKLHVTSWRTKNLVSKEQTLECYVLDQTFNLTTSI